jgi:GIY-YIG catalytic domain
MTREIIRRKESDARWQEGLRTFLKAAAKSRKGVLIDYLFEPPDQVVPQRLYNYAVHDDYVVRLRDEFEFGFDLITRARMVDGRRTYGVYVIELDGDRDHLYVGQSWYLPEERLQQHLTGFAVFHAAKPFKAGARGRLRPDLYEHIPRFHSQAAAEKMEAKWANELRLAGYLVEGGH